MDGRCAGEIENGKELDNEQRKKMRRQENGRGNSLTNPPRVSPIALESTQKEGGGGGQGAAYLGVDVLLGKRVGIDWNEEYCQLSLPVLVG